MPPIVLTEAGVIAVAAAIKAAFDYNTKLLEKVPEQAALVAEQMKPWFKLAVWFNKVLGID